MDGPSILHPINQTGKHITHTYHQPQNTPTVCPLCHLKSNTQTLTPDNKIDVLASRVAHIVDSRTVVEACVGRCDSPQNQRWPSDLGTEGKGARVARPRHSGERETCSHLAGKEHILTRVHNHRVVY